MDASLTTRFESKPFFVDGVHVTADNMEQVAEWCGGEIRYATNPRTKAKDPYIHVPVIRPQHDRQTKAFVGDHVLFAMNSYKVYTDKAFTTKFQKSELAEAA